MLLLLALVHLLFRSGNAAPVPDAPSTRTPIDSCNDINNHQCRKLIDIIWGCLTTIVACTWVSVHPNVPPPNQSRLALLWRRLKMMLIVIIAPEIMVAFAARQFFSARNLSKGAEAAKASSSISEHLTLRHTRSSFAWSSTGYPIVTKKQLAESDLGPEFLADIQNIDAEDIMDKSKGDALSKGVALAQGLWFTTQCIARVQQHLAVTELEVATLAFAVVNIFIWLLWWDKPLDVQRQIVVGPPRPADAQPISSVPVNLGDRLLSAIIGIEQSYAYDPSSSTSVSSFWSSPVDEAHAFERTNGNSIILAFIGTLFGTIHCTAWNANFPTNAEMQIWRLCASLIAAIPVSFLLIALALDRVGNPDEMAAFITGIMALWGMPIYIPARLGLIILPLIALRSLPASAFADVNWSAYIPHF
ncbi:hypothetical protein B0H19DRAFT_928116 [Mycena capillaripes]|nr:hypothetical protein B0H19DRAFT_928116 [Mycena capillaripes]